MDNQNESGSKAPEKKGLAIVDRIAALLKLDDKGRLTKFFNREIKKLERGISVIEANKKSAKMTYDLDLIKLTEEIEDNQQAVEDAYESVDIEKIKNNADSDEFATDYWNNIKYAENALDASEKCSKELTEKYNDKIDSLDEDIRIRKERIAKLK